MFIRLIRLELIAGGGIWTWVVRALTPSTVGEGSECGDEGCEPVDFGSDDQGEWGTEDTGYC